jgi:hypothetical protein
MYSKCTRWSASDGNIVALRPRRADPARGSRCAYLFVFEQEALIWCCSGSISAGYLDQHKTVCDGCRAH